MGYVSLKREGFLCTVKAAICPEHKATKKNYSVFCIIDEEQQIIKDMQCLTCAAARGYILVWVLIRLDNLYIIKLVNNNNLCYYVINIRWM